MILVAAALPFLVWPGGEMVVWPLLILSLPPLLLSRRPVLGLILTLLLAPFLILWVGNDPVLLGGLLAVWTSTALLAARASRWVSAPWAVVAALGQIGILGLRLPGSHYQPGSWAVVLLIMLCVWLVASSVGESRRRSAATRARQTEQAIEAERLRIAREMHDLIAHSLGVIAIQAGVGARVIESQPGEARNALKAIESTSRQTLAELRRTLTALRRSDPEGVPVAPAPGLADLGRLVQTARDAGVVVEVERLGDVRRLPADLELSVFRIVQESVTNVVRHAGTPGCLVRLDFRSAELVVEVLDEGLGTLVVTGSGYGLVGMRERVTLLGGQFSAGCRPEGGFRVAARLPVPAAALSA